MQLAFFGLLLSQILIVTSFYISTDPRLKKASLKGEVTSLNIKYSSEEIERFPKKFEINLKDHLIKFIRVKNDDHNAISSANIYTTDLVGKVKKFNSKSNNEDFEIYKEMNGNSFATLIENEDYEIDKTSHRYRMLGTIHENTSSVFDILPVSPKKFFRKSLKSTYNSDLNSHIITKRVDKTVQNLEADLNDYVKIKKNRTSKESSNREKRSNNGVPFELYCELLIVTDLSVYEDHKIFAQSSDQTLVFLHMKAYFAHYANGINQRFQNSFKTDLDMRLTIKLNNFLFLTRSSDSSWTSSQLYGVPFTPTYKNKEVVLAPSVLDAFSTYIESLTLDFEFDHAIGLFNKDMWSGSNSGADQRSSVVGLAYLSGICSPSKYSIAEEQGGFAAISVAAHEIGHNFGSLHDGVPGQFSAFCSASSNFLMTPGIGSFQTNLLNLLQFSSCSIQAFKALVLTNSNSAVSQVASCLLNKPVSNGLNVYLEDKLPGQSLTADDQCKRLYGSTASFCLYLSSSMCTSLACRKSDTETSCNYFPGIGAAEGTTCDSGKMCLSGVCTASSKAPTLTCPFGNDIVVNKQVIFAQLPTTQMSCDDVFDFIATSLNQFPLSYCSDTNFKSVCCSTCQKYEKLTCFDTIPNCNQYASSCNTGATLNDININIACPKTCGVCSNSVLTCNDVTCANGGTCTNIQTTSPDALDGFQCNCVNGFSGYLCETVNQCSLNPCKNGGTCQNFGSLGYVCQCTPGCSGYNCTNCNGQTNPTPIITTIPNSPCLPNPCQNNGVCFPNGQTYFCQCTSQYTGNQCTTYNPCSSNPCLNGGSCSAINSNTFQCNCQINFNGLRCEFSLLTTPSPTTPIQNDPCFPNPCFNNGVCYVNGPNTFFCQCTQQFTGSQCTQLSVCFNNPCLNGGQCSSDSANNFQCSCLNGFYGTTCEFVVTTTTTTTTSASPVTGTCIDQDINCVVYANNGYCKPFYSVNGIPLTKYCEKSCGLCIGDTLPTTTIQTCIDRNLNCPYYAANNLCKNYYYISGVPLDQFCALSCNKCNNQVTTTQILTTVRTTTSTTTRTIPSGTCFDVNPNNCVYFASKGYCQKNYYIGYTQLSKYCAKSCNMCENLPECKDNQGYCPLWSSLGLCANLADINACQKSCGIC